MTTKIDAVAVLREALEIADKFCGSLPASVCSDSVHIPIRAALAATAQVSGSPAERAATQPTLSPERIDWLANCACSGGVAYPHQVKCAINDALREAGCGAATQPAGDAAQLAALILTDQDGGAMRISSELETDARDNSMRFTVTNPANGNRYGVVVGIAELRPCEPVAVSISEATALPYLQEHERTRTSASKVREEMRQDAKSYVGVVSEGWKLVPIEPSKEMRKAAQKAEIDLQERKDSGQEVSYQAAWPSVWPAMLAASPVTISEVIAPVQCGSPEAKTAHGCKFRGNASAAFVEAHNAAQQEMKAEQADSSSAAPSEPYGWVNAGTERQQTEYATLSVGSVNPWVDGANAFPVYLAAPAGESLSAATADLHAILAQYPPESWAVRNRAFEEAATIIDAAIGQCTYGIEAWDFADHVASEIRALKAIPAALAAIQAQAGEGGKA